jgi:hypothetical protein
MLVQVPTAGPVLEVFGRLANAGCSDLIADVFVTIVAESFGTHTMRHATEREVRRRTGILERWLRKICDGDKQPIGRALHLLRPALLAELDGRKYEPPSMAVQTLVPEDRGIAHLATAIMARIKSHDLAV